MKTYKKVCFAGFFGSVLLALPMLAAADNYEWYYSLDPYTASNQIPELEHYYTPDVAPNVGYAYPKYSGKWDWRKSSNRHLQTRQTQTSVYIPEVQLPVRIAAPTIPTVDPVVTNVTPTPVVQIPWRSRHNASTAGNVHALPWNDLSSR